MAYEFTCRSAGMDCPFMVRSENRDEVVEMVRQHARDVHDTEMSRNDVQDVIQEV